MRPRSFTGRLQFDIFWNCDDQCTWLSPATQYEVPQSTKSAIELVSEPLGQRIVAYMPYLNERRVGRRRPGLPRCRNDGSSNGR